MSQVALNNDHNPSIYVSSLADYNNGTLYGKWFDLTKYFNEDELLEDIKELLENSPLAKEGENVEEWEISDYENLPSFLSEHSNLDLLIEYANTYISDGDAFEAYIENVYSCKIESADDLQDAISGFEDAFEGEFDNVGDFAEYYLETTGLANQIPEWVQGYFDFKDYGDDLFYGGDYVKVKNDNYKIYVFRNL